MKVWVHNEIHSITSRGWWNCEKETKSPYFFLPFRVVVVVVDVVTSPLFFAQAGEQYHFSGGGCFNPTHGKWNWKGKDER
jgi:hypothetical protein